MTLEKKSTLYQPRVLHTIAADTIIVALSSTIMAFLRSEITRHTIIADSVKRQSVLAVATNVVLFTKNKR